MTVSAIVAHRRGGVVEAAGRAPRAKVVEPMVEMNTTPLIDVMLVLLIMLIITIPPQNHDVKINLPGPPPPLPARPDPVKNQLRVEADGALRWNGKAMNDSQVRAMLTATATMEPRPELHFQPDAASRYDRVDQVMAMVKQSGVTTFGFVGNEQYQGSF